MTRKRIAIYDPALHLFGGGEKYATALAEALQDEHEVHLFGKTDLSASELTAFFGVDLSKTQLHVLPAPTLAMKVALRLRLPGAFRTLRDHQYFHWFKRQRFDQFHSVCFDGTMPNPSPEGIYSIMFPTRFTGVRARVNAVTRWLARHGWPVGLAALHTHQTWLTISEYTKAWTRTYWGEHDTPVLYPVSEVPRDPMIPKRRVILNVGRFFAMSPDNMHHHKRQDVLIEAFAGMPELHAQGWELHLAGAVNGERTNSFLEDVLAKTADLPIHVHPDATLTELRRLLNEASLYWHATGYGTDPDALPSAQEHFGIAPVEAMGTGAVPLVYGTAGPAETVVDRVSGRHWHTIAELQAQTRELAADQASWQRLSDGAVSRSRDFSAAAFTARVRALCGKERS